MKLGRRQPKNAPALRFADFFSGTVPDHPAYADHLNIGGWNMLGNDQYGDCVAVTWANERRLMTRQAGKEVYPNFNQVIEFYRTQNPGFPNDDNGMDIQTALEELAHNGGPDGAKVVAFAKIDPKDVDMVKAAMSILGHVWVGVIVQNENMDDFKAGRGWDYHPNGTDDGGHSIVFGGYDSDNVGIDQRFVTWGLETGVTDAYWSHKVEEVWAVVWPEHFTAPAFQEGIDVTKLAQAYKTITGRTLPIPDGPVTPPVTPPTGAASFPGADPGVDAAVARAAARRKMSTSAWLNAHLKGYFKL